MVDYGQESAYLGGIACLRPLSQETKRPMYQSKPTRREVPMRRILAAVAALAALVLGGGAGVAGI